MIKNTLIVFLGVISFSLMGQSVWKKSDVKNFRDATDEDRMIMPTSYEAYELDFDQMVVSLKDAPSQDEKIRSVQGKVVNIPMPDGTFENFEMYYAPVMAPKLAAKYSSIRSYKGYSTTNKSKNLRLDVGPYGLHAAIHGLEGIVYIDPYAKGNKEEYLVYDVKDYMTEVEFDVPSCGAIDNLKDQHFDDIMQTRSADGEVPLRVYRAAIACTGEFGAQRVTPENVTADIVTSVNRLNQIFENEIAVRIVLIDNNDELYNFNSMTDPYLNTNSGSAMLQVNTGVINSRVGSASYDIGHVYARACDVGGIARLGSMCDNANKGAGVTCHYSNNIDFMAANTVSHEMGHQMSAQHTFNNCDGENESLGNGYEPGSGSTIMSYGGGCGPARNIFNGSDIYYHVASLMQIYFHTRDGGIADGCAEIVETSNIEPVISLDYENDFNIPDRTYFMLEGSATDANDDNLTYQWEGFNAGPRSPLGAPIGSAPRFRSFPAKTVPYRFFPSADNILSNTFDRTEVLPVGNMNLNFVFNVRDNNSEAGTAVYEEIRFSTVATAEKFEVTSQEFAGVSHEFGEAINVTWNVAGTNAAPINTQFVDIYFNTSNNTANFNFDNMDLLASRVPNTGSATVYAPDELTFDGRIIVKASDNIYFTINKANIKLDEPSEPSVFFSASPQVQAACLPATAEVEITTQGFAGIEGDVTLSVTNGLPDGATATFSPTTVAVGESSMMTINFSATTPSEKFDVTVKANVDGVDEFERDITLLVSNTDHSALVASSPANGSNGEPVAPLFEWNPSPNAEYYDIEIATEPSFGSSIVISERGLSDTDYAPIETLEKSTVYYWRVIPYNVCGQGAPSKVAAFSTEVLACSEFAVSENSLPVNITQSGTPTITVDIPVTGGSIADVNVTKFIGEHDNNKDMVVHLISPSGTEVLLFSKICNQSDFNCTFDDDSNTPVKCPLNAGGKAYRPKQPFETLIGEQAAGIWKLRIDDTKAGNGGRLEELSLEVCSAQLVESPYLTTNGSILMNWNDTKTITSADLEVKDNNNTAGELRYTVVAIPSNGQLKLNNTTLNVGAQFTQANINNGNISYTSGGINYNTYFSYTVVDGDGGFLGVNDFSIQVDNPNSTFDPVVADQISLYPVPASDRLSIDLSSSRETFTSYEIVDASGRLIRKSVISGKLMDVDVSRLQSGIYIINLMNKELSIPKKIIVE